MSKTTVTAVALAASVAMLPAVERPVSARSDVSSPGAVSAPAPQFSEAAAERMPMAEFKRLFDEGAVVVLDVRGTSAYRDGHVPGSLSVPLDTVGRRAGEWKNETKPIVAYCS
jgi:3-mercaptopyruvate sulfurtransferase SseA